ncbi:enoyl-CoA hydratase-related protein [Dactylosporangium sp. NPDC005572]|uniref:enoyl-CoA hydratase-related protein n=1 Tax=Dactylosporangium sp. NPDC005572 TaxID=3156889 RepID=UPI0033B26331
MTLDSGRLAVDEVDGVLVLRLDRPARRNAMDQALADSLSTAIDRLESVPGLRAGVLTGSDTVFSAGTDLSLPSGPRTAAGGEYGFVRRVRSKPLIAAVEGPAVGGGFEMVLACDLVVASSTASFALPEVRRGVVANCGALFRAPERLPAALAMELLLTGDPMTAERAHQAGLINVLCEPGGAVAGALALARRIAVNSPAAVAATLSAVSKARAEVEERAWMLTAAADREARRSADRAEGIAAFFERRAPRWAAGPAGDRT